MSERGYGYYPEEGGLYTAGLLTGGGRSYKAGLLTGGGLRSFKSQGNIVPSLAWGIKKIQRAGKNSEWMKVFSKYLRDAIDKAQEEYLTKLPADEREEYLKRKRKQLIAKELKKEKIDTVYKILNEKLKDPDGDEDETASKIAKALEKEGVLDNNIFRAALGIIFPDLKKRKVKGRYPDLLQYKMEDYIADYKEKVPKKLKGQTYIGFNNAVKISQEKLNEINKTIEELRKALERLPRTITNVPPKEETVEEPKTPKPKPKKRTVKEEEPESPREGTKTRRKKAEPKPKQKPKRQPVEEEEGEYEPVKEPKSPREKPKGSGLARLRTK